MPQFIAEQVDKQCIGCEKCVTVCPGLAITLAALASRPYRQLSDAYAAAAPPPSPLDGRPGTPDAPGGATP